MRQLISKENYENDFVMGSSSDDGYEIEKLFLDSGADMVKSKPVSYVIMKNCI